jgi:hypothetical protein
VITFGMSLTSMSSLLSLSSLDCIYFLGLIISSRFFSFYATCLLWKMRKYRYIKRKILPREKYCQIL